MRQGVAENPRVVLELVEQLRFHVNRRTSPGTRTVAATARTSTTATATATTTTTSAAAATVDCIATVVDWLTVAVDFFAFHHRIQHCPQHGGVRRRGCRRRLHKQLLWQRRVNRRVSRTDVRGVRIGECLEIARKWRLGQRHRRDDGVALRVQPGLHTRHCLIGVARVHPVGIAGVAGGFERSQ